jgi:hypothetical protein
MKRTYIIRPANKAIAEAINHIGNLNPDKEWEITIGPYKKNKTKQQRDYYHALLDILSDYSGYTKEELKTRMCFSLGYVKDVTLRDGTVIQERLSTEGLGVEKYSKMIDAATMACRDLELRFPAPEEDRGYSR